ncbi:hypothetical protein [uncultured Polaribacter sp.]|uniref:hypothetical protein n=1 Tax=uncultured Polaribacter sp. TaxID=174711 RepID=UPI00262F2E8F|nr:hypothetical protein [uncultured Polaribacter sp.]
MSKNLYRTSKQRDYNYAFKKGLKFGILLILFGIGIYFYIEYEEQKPNFKLPTLLYATYSIGGKLLSAFIWILFGIICIIIGKIESHKLKKQTKKTI